MGDGGADVGRLRSEVLNLGDARGMGDAGDEAEGAGEAVVDAGEAAGDADADAGV